MRENSLIKEKSLNCLENKIIFKNNNEIFF